MVQATCNGQISASGVSIYLLHHAVRDQRVGAGRADHNHDLGGGSIEDLGLVQGDRWGWPRHRQLGVRVVDQGGGSGGPGHGTPPGVQLCGGPAQGAPWAKAAVLSLEAHRGTTVVGEMGTGKTFIAAAAAAHMAGFKRILVLGPPHLVPKWKREVEMTVPGARAVIVKSITDLERLRLSVGSGPLFAVMSREKAKLSYRWMPAVIQRWAVSKGRLLRDEETGEPFRVPCCPDCTAQIVDKDGVPLTDEDLNRRKHTCASCGAPLWQADRSGPARYPLNVYQLSPFRRLYIRLTSPHELRENLDRFLEKIEENTDGYHRWNVASAVQIDAAENMPNLREVVTALDERFSPERIRVAILSPDRHGDVLAEIPALMQELQEVSSCETLCIDARSRRRNGLLLADTFDFA